MSNVTKQETVGDTLAEKPRLESILIQVQELRKDAETMTAEFVKLGESMKTLLSLVKEQEAIISEQSELLKGFAAQLPSEADAV
jgi:peptidoglycan hydrolase CwlO-like protein